MYWPVDNNVVTRGSQESNPVSPPGAKVQSSKYLYMIYNHKEY